MNFRRRTEGPLLKGVEQPSPELSGLTLERIRRFAMPDTIVRKAQWAAFVAGTAIGLAVSGPARADQLDGSSPIEEAQQDDSAIASAEAEVIPSVDRITAAFAETRTMLPAPEFSAVPRERLQRAVEILEHFPTERVAQEISVLSGVPVEAVLDGSSLEHVVLYSDAWIESNHQHVADMSGVSAVSPDLVDQWKRAGGFATPDGKVIGVNIQLVAETFPDDQFDKAIVELAIHEFIHSLVYESVYDERFTDLDRYVHEGEVQALALDVLLRLRNNREPLDIGYNTGIKQAAYLVINDLGQELVYHALVTDDHNAQADAWNAKHGEGSWERAMAFQFGTEDVNTIRDMYPLFGLLDELGSDARRACFVANQDMVQTRILPIFNSESGVLEAVYVRDDRLQYSITGGLTRVPFELPDGRHMVLVMYLPEKEDSVTASGVIVMEREVTVTMAKPLSTVLPLVGSLDDGQVLSLLEKRIDRKIAAIQEAAGATSATDAGSAGSNPSRVE